MHLCDGGSHEGVAHGDVGGKLLVWDLAGEEDTALDAKLDNERLQVLHRRLLSAADDQQVYIVKRLGHSGKGAQQEIQVLLRRDAAGEDEQYVRVFEAEVGTRQWLGTVEAAQV